MFGQPVVMRTITCGRNTNEFAERGEIFEVVVDRGSRQQPNVTTIPDTCTRIMCGRLLVTEFMGFIENHRIKWFAIWKLS